MLGHASAAMTLDIYAGVFPDSLDAVADLMDAEALRARQRRDDALRDAAPRRPMATLREVRTKCGPDGYRPADGGLAPGEKTALDLGLLSEPPIGIEPMTFSLRVRRSTD